MTVEYLIDASSCVFQIIQLHPSDKLGFFGVYHGKVSNSKLSQV
jgi:hypothetical protein